MKVRMWVSTNIVNSEVDDVLEFEEGEFEEEDFRQWVWDNIDAGFEIVEDMG